MRDHDDGGPGFLLRGVKDFQHLRLDGDVQRRRGFIGDEHPRIVGDRNGDHDALAHTAREFVREGFEPVLGTRDAHHPQKFDGAGFFGLFAHGGVVDRERLDDLVADRVDGRQRGERILEHHSDVIAAVLAHGFVAQAQEFLAFESD